MSYEKAEFLEVIQKSRLADSSDLNNENLSYFLNKAIEVYSRIRSRTLVADFSGDGSAYEWTLPSNWQDGFSEIISVEYPSGEQDPTILKAYHYRIYQSTTAKKFRLISKVPSSSETVRLTYSAPHVLTDSEVTPYDPDFEAICDLAGSIGAAHLAAKYAQTQSSTLDADTINYLSKVDYYSRLADRLMKSFLAHFGMKEGDISPAISKIGEWDVLFPWGEDLLTHPRVHR